MISIPEKWLFWRQMCWSFSSFVIKSGCTSKESWDCGDTMLSSGERRKKPTGTQSLKFCDKTWPVQNRRLKGFQRSALAGTHVFQCSHRMGSRFPEFQELHLGPGRKYQGVTGTRELDFFISEFEDCCPCFEKETMTEQALPPALLLGIRRPEFSPNPQCKLWRCSIQSELRYLLFSKMLFSLPSLLFCSCSLLYPGIPTFLCFFICQNCHFLNIQLSSPWLS